LVEKIPSDFYFKELKKVIDCKVALITGSTRGIGYGIAQKLAEEGYAVAVNGVSDNDRVLENLKKLEAYGNPVIYTQGDISSGQKRKEIVDKVMNEFGRIDLLVNNAGVAPKERLDILETSEESFDYVTGINVKGTFFMTQLVANVMIGLLDKGIKPRIINISSISAYTSSTNRPEYCISKAGISMITKLFADRLAEYGIGVFEIRPGIIYTDMTSTVRDKYNRLIEQGITPIKRWGYPEDIANAVSVLASGKLDFSTGQVINVDGGFHIRRL